MPNDHRNPDATTSSREVGVCFVVEMDGGVLSERRRDDGSWAFTAGTLEDGGPVEDAFEFPEESHEIVVA
jgi:8-oxo-dGTP pyrophosphatase MutT (NUDIX family)